MRFVPARQCHRRGGHFNFHHDSLQSVLGQIWHEGSILNTQSYSPFGVTLSQTETTTNALQYTGREVDGETEVYYYRARYYDPIIGRFISEDPNGFGAGVNFYAYGTIIRLMGMIRVGKQVYLSLFLVIKLIPGWGLKYHRPMQGLYLLITQQGLLNISNSEGMVAHMGMY
jgi:RHS repeat-associated protein